RERRRRLDEACAAAGRDPATLGYSLMVTAVVADDRAALAERVRRVRELAGREPPPHWLVGSVEELAERLAALEAVGVSRVLLQHLDHRDLDAVATMGRLARA